jgi:RNA polymerase sigma factor (sigma-70 family)
MGKTSKKSWPKTHGRLTFVSFMMMSCLSHYPIASPTCWSNLTSFQMIEVAAKERIDPEMETEDFRAMLVAHLPHLRAFGRGLAGRSDLADDLVQDTAIKAWAAKDSFIPGTNFKAWTFRILRNNYINSIRRNRFHGEYDPEVAERKLIAAPDQEDRIHLKDLEKALSQLSTDRREALFLIGASGLSYDEAADICGVPVGTMKSRVARARAELKTILKDPAS